MGEILKQLYSVKTLGLGWSVFWRSFLVLLAHAVIIGILGAILQNLSAAIAGIFNLIAGIFMMLVGFMATGWAVLRIKDKLG